MPHTWFLQEDHVSLATFRIGRISLHCAVWRWRNWDEKKNALPALRELEGKTKTRIRDFIIAARALLEDDVDESIAAVNRIIASDFQDPEGLFYLSRHLATLNEVGPALQLFERVVAGGYFCYPAMAKDPWLDSLRKKPAFSKLLRQAETQHRNAAAAFKRLNGEKVLGVALQ